MNVMIPIQKSDDAPSLLALFPEGTLNVADVADFVRSDSALADTRRRDMVSALSRIAAVLGLPLDAIPANVPWLRKKLGKIHPVQLGITKKTWQNVLSTALGALTHCGVGETIDRRIQLDPRWQAVWNHVTDRNLRNGLSRFARFCARRGIRPGAVADTTVADYRAAIELASLRKNPDLAIYLVTTSWNRASETIEVWPDHRLTVPQRTKRIAVDWSDLPHSFHADAKAYTRLMQCTDPMADNAPPRPLASATIKFRLRQLRRFCAELVRSGIAMDNLTDLAAIVRPEIAKQGLASMIDGHGGKTSGAIHNMAYTLMSIAKHYVRLPDTDVIQLKILCIRLKPQQHGMTPKNRTRLRQFDDSRNVTRLLALPHTLWNEAKKGEGVEKRAALKVEVALAIELLIMCELRIKNLARLRLDESFQWSRSPGHGICHLVIEPHEVKNREHLEFELTDESLDLFNAFRDRYRPALVPTSSPWLFGRRDGAGPVSESVLAGRIRKTIWDRTGLLVHPHLFRAIGSKLYLDQHPGGYEVVRRMLGHKSLSTTLSVYTGLESVSAAKHFDNVLRNIRRDAAPVPSRRRIKPRRTGESS